MIPADPSYYNPLIREEIPALTGWLVSPTRDRALFFIRDTKCQMSFPDVITQLWFCTVAGIPIRLKNTRRMDLESAIETWTELITNGWEFYEHQMNENAA